jgi:hypothetical protein
VPSNPGSKWKIIVKYRRFYKWLPSLYAELHRHLCFEEDFPSFVEWFRTENISHGLRPSVVAARYHRYFKDAQVLDFHGNESFQVIFFCNMLDNLSGRACTKAKESETRVNVRENDLDAKRIYHSAQKQVLMQNRSSSLDIYLAQTFLFWNKYLPFECLAESRWS